MKSRIISSMTKSRMGSIRFNSLKNNSLRTNSSNSSNSSRMGSSRMDSVMNEQINIPLFIFRDRQVAGLEGLVEYLHDVKKLSFHEIAVLVNRDDRTIWTVYSRAKIKRKKLLLKNNQ